MLLVEYDESLSAVINSDMVTEKIADFPEIAVSCFSKNYFIM